MILRRGLEHMRRNLGRVGGRKQRRAPAAKAKAARRPKARPKANVLQPRLSPALKSRSVWAVLSVLAHVIYMPSRTMVHLVMEHFLIWIRDEWGEPAFASYFQREYLREQEVREDRYGRRTLLWADWWSGAGNTHSWDCPGHPASQQAAEQANSKTKRDIRDHAPGRKLTSHQDVVSALLGCLATWLRPIRQVDEASDGPVTLMGPANGLHPFRPDRPDGWMLSGGLLVRVPCGGNRLHRLPAIGAVLNKMRTCRRRKPMEETTRHGNKHLGGRHRHIMLSLSVASCQNIFRQRCAH